MGAGLRPRTVFTHCRISQADPCSLPRSKDAGSPDPGGSFSSALRGLGLDDLGRWYSGTNLDRRAASTGEGGASACPPVSSITTRLTFATDLLRDNSKRE